MFSLHPHGGSSPFGAVNPNGEPLHITVIITNVERTQISFSPLSTTTATFDFKRQKIIGIFSPNHPANSVKRITYCDVQGRSNVIPVLNSTSHDYYSRFYTTDYDHHPATPSTFGLASTETQGRRRSDSLGDLRSEVDTEWGERYKQPKLFRAGKPKAGVRTQRNKCPTERQN